MAERIPALDIARGVAILGTLATNIWIFSHPEGMFGYLNSPVTADLPAWQGWLEKVLQQLANGKFLGLLTLMFGIGLAIQADAAARRGLRWPGSYLWRALLLFLDGLLNYLLVIEFDVLMGYAVTGAIVACLLATSPRSQRVWFTVTAGVHIALILFITAGLLSGQASLGSGEPLQPNPYRDGSWWDLVVLRWQNPGLFRFEPVLILAGSIALFLAGAWLHRNGVFGAHGRVLRRRLMFIGAVALGADLGLGLADPDWMPLTRWVISPVVAAGLLALIVELVGSREPGWAGRRLAEVGRVALSAYIVQNIIASIVFHGWGFDLGAFGSPRRTAVSIGGWVAICALVVLGAHLWLRRFRRGPVEWLWNRGYEALSRSDRGRTAAHPWSGGVAR
ncbi:DUF418 domain-containing protein [Naumannella halotolerans]|uniref:DUF418 domain-containing protein n=1 Tax=Naumannella halotolerans TaxID=993414 RepID=A0A4R7IWP2_9ACTN|nr:DUF418 domain-containing protein [Naumannella halotolerans]TDT29091.1 uncharacterized protein CLV29_3185 [Naumannella halotolerans]